MCYVASSFCLRRVRDYNNLRCWYLGDVGDASCGPNEWLCAASQQCIGVNQVCDRVPNCANGADESENCSTCKHSSLFPFRLPGAL